MSQTESSPYKESHWALPPRAQPYAGAYSGPPAYHAPSSTASHPPASEMLTLPPPPTTSASHMAQDPYRPPPAHYDPYGAPPGQMPYPPSGHHPLPPQHQQQPPVNFTQPAPRQRTAIACRYCRRRKIRCHGFDQSPDGRCTNCARFHQDCIFTPVSSQAHAFVPAHTAYPHLRTAGRGAPDGRPMYAQGPPVYSAHGQPLGPVGGHQHESYHPPPPPPQQYGPGQYPHYDDRAPPHAPDRGAAPPARRSSGTAYEYPDPAQMAPVSPATAGGGYAAPGPYPPAGQSQPYYQPQPPRRPSPPSSSYGYDARTSTSPHSSTTSTSYANYGGLHPPQALPPAYDATRTPPPGPPRETNGTTNGSRPGMSVRDMLGPEPSGGRSSADSDMLKALNRRGM